MELAPHQRVHNDPQLSIQECIEAAQDVYEGSLSTSDFAPWQRVPYRGRRRAAVVIAVLQVPLAISAPANAAGIALQTANSQFLPTPIPLLDPSVQANPDGSVDLFTIKPEARSKELKLDSWGITISNAVNTAVQLGARGGTAGGLPDPPNPELSTHRIDDHQPAEAIVTENKEIVVTALNRTIDSGAPSPILIKLGVTWWEFPIDRYVDSRKKSRLKGGYGTGC